jgi:PIN domain nuclease of toxin-antitoxin system
MRLLLDTRVFIWAVADSKNLKPAARDLMAAADEVHVSAVSIREIAIKARLGKIQGDPAAFADAIEESGFLELAVRAHHGAAVANLPFYHTDPFDRLLVAQAMAEPLHFLTADAALTQYSSLVQIV